MQIGINLTYCLFIYFKMNISHLSLFVQVAKTQNISQAGKTLNLSAAVASAYINKLEASLGVTLLHRTTRNVSLTDEGERFLPHALSILESIDNAKGAVGKGARTPHGTLKVTAPASFGRMHIIPGLVGFRERYPKLEIELRLSDTIVDLVEGGFDIAIRNAVLADSSLKAKKLAKDTRKIVASPKYIEKFGEPHSPQDLKNHQCLPLIGLENWQFDTPNGPTTIKIASSLRMDNGEAVRDACAQGLGITISSAWCCYDKLQSGELIEVLKKYPLHHETNIWALYANTHIVSPKIRVFIDYFADYFSNELKWGNLS